MPKLLLLPHRDELKGRPGKHVRLNNIRMIPEHWCIPRVSDEAFKVDDGPVKHRVDPMDQEDDRRPVVWRDGGAESPLRS